MDVPEETANAAEEDDDADDGVTVNFCSLAVESLNSANPAPIPKYLDSGCSSNMTPRTPELTDFHPQTEKILLGGKGHDITSEGRGTLGVLRDVMVSNELRHTLVSVPKFDRDGMYTVFGGGHAFITDEAPIIQGNVVMSATLQNHNMYKMDDVASTPSQCHAAEDERSSAQENKKNKPITQADRRLVRGSFGLLKPGSTATLNAKQVLHRRLGHISEKGLETLLKNNAVIGAGTTYAAIKSMELGLCDACLRGKMHARHVPSSRSRDRSAMMPMEEIAMDPVPMSKCSLQGNTYATIGLDLHSSYAFVVPARTKGEQVTVLEKINFQIADKYGHTIKTLHTDSDSVYMEKEFQDYCKANKIHQAMSTPYIHQENGSVENLIGKLDDSTRVALIDAQASEGYWEYAMQMAVYAHNRTLHGPDETKTPYEKLTGKAPDISIMRPFGAHCWVQISEDERAGEGARWKDRACAGVIVGYADHVPGAYLVLISVNPPVVRVRRNVVVAECPPEAVLWNLGKPVKNDVHIMKRSDGQKIDESEDEADEETPAPVLAPELRRSNRVPVPKSIYANAAIEMQRVPLDLNEAMGSPERDLWRVAVEKELNNYKSRGGLRSIRRSDIPHGATILDMKQVLKRTKISEREYKYKFRLAVRGFKQIEGLDYTDTYSPTVMVKTVMVVLHLAAHYGWDSHHLDVGCAYMEAPPDRVMYIRVGKDLQRHGFCDSEYAILGTNAYGTKQAGRVWYLFMASVLIFFEMLRSASDVCLFYKWNEDHTLVLIVIVYVDDFGATGSWLAEIERFLQYMRDQYSEIKVTTPMTKYVGLELQWDMHKHTVDIGQEQYTNETVEELLDPAATVVNNPLAYTTDYREPVELDREPIWDIVGKVRYLADRTRPDLTVPAGTLGSFQAKPGLKHVRGAQHVLRYCKGTANAKMRLGGEDPIVLQGSVDASYDTKYACKPTLGYALYLGPNCGAIMFKSKRATTMANSVGEAETRAASEAVREVVWTRGLLEELGEPQQVPTEIRADSQAMIDITKDYANNPRIGCFNRDVQWIRQALEQGIVKFKKVPSAENESDLLTKLLPAVMTKKHNEKISGIA
ncbi:MAG: DDE-type integrase/transposase/recombinase [Gammaproteobacteria bacterium]|nr:DDE-type integrase/transposase/recombinase [Gammaproteobacteria bacterium]